MTALAGVATIAAGVVAAPMAAQAGVVSARGGVVLAGQSLLPGHHLDNRGIWAYLSRSGDLRLFSPSGRLLWASHTGGHPDATGLLRPDGDFVLRTRGGHPFWSTHTFVPGSRVIVLKAAVLAVQAPSGKLVWSAGTPTPPPVPVSPPVAAGSPQTYATGELAVYGWSANSQWPCLDSLWQRESGWDYQAENPSSGAYGIPQALPGAKMASAGADWATDPDTQIRWGLTYIQSVYGTPCAAWAHSQATGWY